MKELKNKAYERKGMPSYSEYDVPQLKTMCTKRFITFTGRAGTKKLTSLLEDWDDANLSDESSEDDDSDSD